MNETASNPVAWFEIPVRDMARAKAFYEYLLDCTLDEHSIGGLAMAWFPMHEQGTGATGSLVKGEHYAPSAGGGVMVYFSIDDIDQALARATARGGRVVAEKFSIGDYGFVGIIEDCEGNRVGLHSHA